MTTRNIQDINELDSFWQSKYQKFKNAQKNIHSKLQDKLTRLHTRAKVDYKFNELIRLKHPEIHLETYAELAKLGINTRGIVRPPSKSKQNTLNPQYMISTTKKATEDANEIFSQWYKSISMDELKDAPRERDKLIFTSGFEEGKARFKAKVSVPTTFNAKELEKQEVLIRKVHDKDIFDLQAITPDDELVDNALANIVVGGDKKHIFSSLLIKSTKQKVLGDVWVELNNYITKELVWATTHHDSELTQHAINFHSFHIVISNEHLH